MNEILRDLISRFLEDPENLAVARRIRKMRTTEGDFSNDLFESFGATSRRQIYAELLIWTDRSNWLKILERRVNSELDLDCNKRLRFMIKGLKEQPSE